MYGVEFLPSAARTLAKLDRPVQHRIARRIERLAHDPHSGSVKLRGSEDTWRVRVGDYHVLYVVGEGRLTVVVVRVPHPREGSR